MVRAVGEASISNTMITLAFGFLAGVCFTLALFEAVRLENRAEDERINNQRFSEPTHAGPK